MLVKHCRQKAGFFAVLSAHGASFHEARQATPSSTLVTPKNARMPSRTRRCLSPASRRCRQSSQSCYSFHLAHILCLLRPHCASVNADCLDSPAVGQANRRTARLRPAPGDAAWRFSASLVASLAHHWTTAQLRQSVPSPDVSYSRLTTANPLLMTLREGSPVFCRPCSAVSLRKPGTSYKFFRPLVCAACRDQASRPPAVRQGGARRLDYAA